MEIFDIVDENGNPTGETVERNAAHENGFRHRTAHVWIARNVMGKWQVLLQKRAMTKDSFPGRYDTSSAGHIQAGDEPLESAIRELEEELGIIATTDQLEFAGTFRVQYEKEFHKENIRIIYFPYTKGISSTQISKALKHLRTGDDHENEP